MCSGAVGSQTSAITILTFEHGCLYGLAIQAVCRCDDRSRHWKIAISALTPPEYSKTAE
jgi:hypothetical protein